MSSDGNAPAPRPAALGAAIGAVFGAAAGAVLTALLRATGEASPVWYLVAVAAACGAAAGTLRAVAGRTALPATPPHGAPPPPERALPAVDQMADRIRRATAKRSGFTGGLRPVLRDLVDDRLQRRTGAGLDAIDPVRGRELLGEPLWQWLRFDASADGDAPPPTARELAALVSRIEAL